MQDAEILPELRRKGGGLMGDRIYFNGEQLPYILALIITAYEAGKNAKESELGKKIASDDALWRMFFHGDEGDS